MRWDIPKDQLEHACRIMTPAAASSWAFGSCVGLTSKRRLKRECGSWLDWQLVGRVSGPAPKDIGFGHEAIDALSRRQQWLIEEGLARKDGDQISYRRNLLATLSRQELAKKGEGLASSEGRYFRMAEDGERVSGRYRGCCGAW